jgi:hypothetical protein
MRPYFSSAVFILIWLCFSDVLQFYALMLFMAGVSYSNPFPALGFENDRFWDDVSPIFW